MKPRGSVQDLVVLAHFSSFKGDASACATRCCNHPSCTTSWMVRSICVLLDCSGDAEEDACSPIPVSSKSSLVKVTRNQGMFYTCVGAVQKVVFATITLLCLSAFLKFKMQVTLYDMEHICCGVSGTLYYLITWTGLSGISGYLYAVVSMQIDSGTAIA